MGLIDRIDVQNDPVNWIDPWGLNPDDLDGDGDPDVGPNPYDNENDPIRINPALGHYTLELWPAGRCPSARYQGPKPKYHVNPQHVPGRGLKPGKTPLPKDAESVFKNAVPNDPKNPTAWFGKNADGQIYRFSAGNDRTAHFSGIHGVGDSTRNLTDYAIQRLGGL